MATIHNFENALNEQRERIKTAFHALVMVYGGEEYSGLKNTYKHRLNLLRYNLPIKKVFWLVSEGLDVWFEDEKGGELPFDAFNTDTLANCYDRLVNQINAILKTE